MQEFAQGNREIMSKGIDIFEAGNGIWGGRVFSGYDRDGRALYKTVYGLSVQSVYDKAKTGADKDVEPAAAAGSESRKRSPVPHRPVSDSINVIDIMIVRSVDVYNDGRDGAPAQKGQAGDMTVAALCDEWIIKRSGMGISEKTVESEINMYKRYVKPAIGNVLCSDLNRGHIESVMVRMLRRDYSRGSNRAPNGMLKKQTLFNYIGRINDLLEYGASTGVIPSEFRVHLNMHSA